MELFLLGTSHSTASTPLRERMHVDPDRLLTVLGRMTRKGHLAEGAALVTCGRFEVYGVADEPESVRAVLGRFTSRETGLPVRELARHSYFRTGAEAVADHLFAVAAGLDSVVQGEAQILGQVRDMLPEPDAADTLGPVLHRLIEMAVSTGKRVRTETEIGRGAASIASAALDLVRRRGGTLEDRRAVVVGAGDTAGLVARLLVKAGVSRLRIVNRTPERARQLVRELGTGTSHALAELPRLLRDTDLLVGAAASPDYLVDCDTASAWQAAAPARRYVVDLSHPRVIDPRLAQFVGVEVLDLQAVHERVAAVRQTRAAQVPVARAVVAEEVDRFVRWARARAAAPVVRAVSERVLEQAREAARRHARGLEPEQRETLQRFARSLARTLLHEPTRALREADVRTVEGRGVLRAAEALFGVASDGEPVILGTERAS